MATTSEVTIPQADWTEVGAGAARVVMQLQSLNEVFLHIAATKPAADSSVGLVLDRVITTVGIDALDTNDRIWLRSFDGTATVCVMAFTGA